MRDDATTVGDEIRAAREFLGTGPVAALEMDVLLAHVLGVDRPWLFANRERLLPLQARQDFRILLERRGTGVPVAYLTGRREFWSLPLRITPDVLIPRAETELLVEVALQSIPVDATWRVADLGTGSGAVAIAIARERPSCEVHATECDQAALKVAECNVRNLAPGRVHLHLGSWLEPLSGRFRVIVCNPPYIAADDPHLAVGDCRFEPRKALTPGPDALAAIRQIARDATAWLEPGGLLAFEHGFDQGHPSRSLLQDLAYTQVCTYQDLEGRDRVTAGHRPD